MFFLLELLIVMSYLINGYLGFGVTIVALAILLMKKTKYFNQKLLDILILVLPLHSISVIGDKLPHVFSWPVMGLALLTIYNIGLIIKNKIKIDNILLTVLGLSLFLLCLGNLKNNVIQGVIEIGQVMLMVIPILTTIICKDYWKEKVNKNIIQEYLIKIADVVFAVAVAVILQCIIYNIFELEIGNITVFKGRIIYDIFFNAYSVLSIFLGIGVVILVQKCLLKDKNELISKRIMIFNLIKIIIILAAMVINSSRTGMLAALFTCFIMAIYKSRLLDRKKRITLFGAILFLACVSIFFMSFARQDVSSFFSDNARFETYKYGIDLVFSNIWTFIIGNGLDVSNYNEIMPHNFVIETMMTCGIIITFIVIFSLARLTYVLRKTKYFYIVCHILISSMFITCFYGNPFTTIIFILAILDSNFLELEEVNIDGQTTVNNSSNTSL